MQDKHLTAELFLAHWVHLSAGKRPTVSSEQWLCPVRTTSFLKLAGSVCPLVLHTAGVPSFPLSTKRKDQSLKGSAPKMKGSAAEMIVYITRSRSYTDKVNEMDGYLVQPAELIMRLLMDESTLVLMISG